MTRFVAKLAGICALVAGLTVLWVLRAWLLAVPASAAALNSANALPAPQRSAELSAALPVTTVAAPPPAAPSPSPIAAGPPLTNTRNLLLIGLDRRPDGGGAALADTLIVVVLDQTSRHVGLVSIPRDLYVPIPDQAPDRINTLYALARRTRQDPLKLLGRVVEDTLKLPIEHALALDLGVFERAVDAVSGIDVEVPCPIRDRFLDARAPEGSRLLDIDAGPQRMDGVTAAMYARSRHGRSDFSRARRQQALMLGLRNELSAVGGLLRVPALWSEFEHSIHTDLKRVELFSLARRALATKPSELHGLVLTPPYTRSFRTADGRAVLQPESEAIAAALSKLFSAPSPGVRPELARCEPKDVALGGAR